MSDEKRIRFIDSRYNTLFTIPDGGNIKINYPDGETVFLPADWPRSGHLRRPCQGRRRTSKH